MRLVHALDELAHDADEQALPCFGIEGWRGTLGVGHAEEIEEQRERFGEGQVEQDHSPRDFFARAAVVIPEGDTEIGAENLEDGCKTIERGSNVAQ